MINHRTLDSQSYARATTAELRRSFLIEGLFAPGRIDLVYTDLDRAIVGSAVPTDGPLTLEAGAQLRVAFFCERSELGVMNVGAAGRVIVDGASHPLEKLDTLYVGRSARDPL